MGVSLRMPCSASSRCSVKLRTNHGTKVRTGTLASYKPSPFHIISLRTSPASVTATTLLVQHDGRVPTMKEDDQIIKPKTHEFNEESVNAIIVRLNTAVERVRDFEIRKFISSRSGDAAADEMSREIASKLFDKPIMYLTSGGDLKVKLNDVKILITMLENSCPSPNNWRRSP